MNKFALALTIIGGINWGLIGLFRFDLVAWIFGGSTTIGSRIVYGLVGLAALCASACCSVPGKRASHKSEKDPEKAPRAVVRGLFL